MRRIFKNKAVGAADFPKITDLAGPDATMLIPYDIDGDGRMDLIV